MTARVLPFYGLDHIFLALSILWSPREITPADVREGLLRLVSGVLQLGVFFINGDIVQPSHFRPKQKVFKGCSSILLLPSRSKGLKPQRSATEKSKTTCRR